ncbi:MAG: hypothetical protein R2753_09940 [Chitinophagales bacterium]
MKKIFLLLITITTLFSCSKDDAVSPSGDIQGRYIVLETPVNYYKTAYIDNSTISLLGEYDVYGTRARYDIPYEQVNDTLITVYNTSTQFSIAWEGNKLTINSGTGDKYVLIVEASTPTAEEWVTTVNPITKIQQASFSMDRIEDMTYYNGTVYTDGHRNLDGNYVITKIDLQNFSTTDIAIAPANTTTLGYNDNIEYVGSNEFWVYDWGNPNDHMFEFNANTLEKKSTVLMPYQFGSIYHMGSNETVLYGSFYEDIRKWDFVGQKWGNKIELGTQLLDGLDVDDEYLYIAGNSTIHKYSLNPFKAVAAYDISKNDTYSFRGFTLTYGNQIVASVYNYTTTKNEIVTITLP